MSLEELVKDYKKMIDYFSNTIYSLEKRIKRLEER